MMLYFSIAVLSFSVSTFNILWLSTLIWLFQDINHTFASMKTDDCSPFIDQHVKDIEAFGAHGAAKKD
jgi:hypothetical protein